MRQPVAGKARQILLFQRLSHFRRFFIMQGVIATHDALQFRKLLHHLGQQIAFGQPRRPLGPVGVAMALPTDQSRQRRYPRTLVGQRAQPLLEYHLFQVVHPRRQRVLAVLVPEKFGIAEAGANHPFVASPHLGRVAAC